MCSESIRNLGLYAEKDIAPENKYVSKYLIRQNLEQLEGASGNIFFKIEDWLCQFNNY